MPEWCDNLLTVEGPEELVARFVERARGNPPGYRGDTPETEIAVGGAGTEPDDGEQLLCFHALYPVPDEVLEAGYEEAGYQWEIEHWGCKWGACEQTVAERSPGRVSYGFDNPWDPPVPFLDRVAADWPGLDFTLGYYTDWTGHRGVVRWAGGVSLTHFRERVAEDDVRLAGPAEPADEAGCCECMARRYRDAALAMPGGPTGEMVPVSLLLQSVELLLRWRLAEAAGGTLPGEYRTVRAVGGLLTAVSRLPGWAVAAGDLRPGSRAWWAEADSHAVTFRFPCPPFGDADAATRVGEAPGLPPAATGRRFWRECVALWDAFGGGGDPAVSAG